jgi:hypothetical protein
MSLEKPSDENRSLAQGLSAGGLPAAASYLILPHLASPHHLLHHYVLFGFSCKSPFISLLFSSSDLYSFEFALPFPVNMSTQTRKKTIHQKKSLAAKSKRRMGF